MEVCVYFRLTPGLIDCMTRPLSARYRWTVVSAAVMSLTLVATAQKPATPGTDRKTIEHVLNRVAFGARPGDVERIGAMGVNAYIDAQLHPERIDDSALDARLAEFQTLSMSTQELAEKYFRPAEEARREAQRAQGGQPPPGQPPRRPGQPNQPGQPNEMMTPDMAGAGPGGQAARPARSPEAIDAALGQRNVMNEFMQAKMLRATLSEKQLQEVLVDFWFNHFNVFVGKGQVREYLSEYEREMIRPRVLGRFRDLLGAVAKSPAMLFYLDNFQSSTPNAPGIRPEQMERINEMGLQGEARRQLIERAMRQQQLRPNAQRPQRGINENYARELMELHTLGVDGGYTQQDVTQLARILTGWTIDQPRNGGRFVFREMMHDTGTKVFLGETFGSAGQLEGERALDMLAKHPSTARFLSFKLAQRFIADNPPESVVKRAAAVFTSTKGDLREVVKSIITSPEFFAPEARRAKVKTPLEFVVSATRATGATIVNAQPLVAAMQNLGMPLYGAQPPTGYSMTSDAWVNTGALLNRMTFAASLVDGGRIQPNAQPGRGGQQLADRMEAAGRAAQARRQVPGPGLAPGRFGGRGPLARGPIQVDVAALAPDTSDASRDLVVNALLGGEASNGTRQTLARATTPQNLIALALGSPEFQRR
jgi:uncharacterized protein (DUF1800 family)